MRHAITNSLNASKHYKDRNEPLSIEIVAFDPPRTLTLRGRSRIVHFDDVIELSPNGEGTRLTAHMSAQPQGPMRLMSPLNTLPAPTS